MSKTDYKGYSEMARELAEKTGRHPSEFTADTSEYPMPSPEELEDVEEPTS